MKAHFVTNFTLNKKIEGQFFKFWSQQNLEVDLLFDHFQNAKRRHPKPKIFNILFTYSTGDNGEVKKVDEQWLLINKNEDEDMPVNQFDLAFKEKLKKWLQGKIPPWWTSLVWFCLAYLDFIS